MKIEVTTLAENFTKDVSPEAPDPGYTEAILVVLAAFTIFGNGIVKKAINDYPTVVTLGCLVNALVVCHVTSASLGVGSLLFSYIAEWREEKSFQNFVAILNLSCFRLHDVTMCLVSIERYFIVRNPRSGPMCIKRTVHTVTILWLVTVSYVSADVIWLDSPKRYQPIHPLQLLQCATLERLASEEVTLGLLPAIITAILLTFTGLRIRAPPDGAAAPDIIPNRGISRGVTKTTWIMLHVLWVHLLTWSAITAAAMFEFMQTDQSLHCLLILRFTNCAVFPLALMILSRRVRKVAKKHIFQFRCFEPCDPESQDVTNESDDAPNNKTDDNDVTLDRTVNSRPSSNTSVLSSEIYKLDFHRLRTRTRKKRKSSDSLHVNMGSPIIRRLSQLSETDASIISVPPHAFPVYSRHSRHRLPSSPSPFICLNTPPEDGSRYSVIHVPHCTDTVMTLTPID